jgi:hypothetical protein
MMNFDYSAEITVSARLEKPPRMDEIIYELSVYSQDSSKYWFIKNIEKFGTIFNTVKASAVMGEIKKITD